MTRVIVFIILAISFAAGLSGHPDPLYVKPGHFPTWEQWQLARAAKPSVTKNMNWDDVAAR